MTNEEYQKERNRLIPSAEKYANEKTGRTAGAKPWEFKNHSEWSFNWNCAFLGRMDQLARGIGLI